MGAEASASLCSIPEAATVCFREDHDELPALSLDSSFLSNCSTDALMGAAEKVPRKHFRFDEDIGSDPRFGSASFLTRLNLKGFRDFKPCEPPVPPKREAFRAFKGPCLLASLLCCAQQERDTNMDMMIPTYDRDDEIGIDDDMDPMTKACGESGSMPPVTPCCCGCGQCCSA